MYKQVSNFPNGVVALQDVAWSVTCTTSCDWYMHKANLFDTEAIVPSKSNREFHVQDDDGEPSTFSHIQPYDEYICFPHIFCLHCYYRAREPTYHLDLDSHTRSGISRPQIPVNALKDV